MKNFALFIHLIFVSILFVACDRIQHSKISSFYEFADSEMVPGKEYLLCPFEENEAAKSDSLFSFKVSLRYSDKCRLKNFPVNVEISSLEADSIINMFLEIPLFDEAGVRYGKGNFGIYESDHVLFRRRKIEEGECFTVSTPEKNTAGIISIGIIAEIE